MKVDLHTHSIYSDGTAAPAEVVARAEEAGVALLVLTDHDSVSGFPEALAAARGRSLDVRCGVEINTCAGDNIHILGYGIRREDKTLLAQLARFRERRVGRVRQILENLGRLGIELSYEDIREKSPETLGRAHVADALKRKGLVPHRAAAFHRFLAPGKPAYTPSQGPTPGETIALIREAGGFAVVAHPATVPHADDIESWVGQGLEGIEAYYGMHSPSDVLRFREMAVRWGLLMTGGSDYHGRGLGRKSSLGVELPDEDCRRFLERIKRCD